MTSENGSRIENKYYRKYITNTKEKVTMDEILIGLLSKWFVNITYKMCLNYS